MRYVYEAILAPDSGGGFVARFPDLGIATQGESLRDAAMMACDLLENHITVMLQKGEEIPEASFGCEVGEVCILLAACVDCDAAAPQVETMTVAEAADVLDVSEPRIRAMIRDGILKSEKVGRVHMVDAQSVMDRYNEPVRSGRPRKTAARV